MAALVGQLGSDALRHSDPIRALDLSSDGRLLATALDFHGVRLWDAVSGSLLLHCPSMLYNRSVALSPDAGMLAFGDGDGQVNLVDVASMERRRLSGHGDSIISLAWSPDGSILASGAAGKDRSIRLWDLKGGGEPLVLKGCRTWMSSIAFSPDGTLVAGGGDKVLRVYRTDTGKRVRAFEGHGDNIVRVMFAGSGTVASVDMDGVLWRWDLESGNSSAAEGPPEGWLGLTADGVAFHPDHEKHAKGVVVRHSGREVRLPLHSFLGPSTWTADGRVVALACAYDAEVSIFDLPAGAAREFGVGHRKPVRHIALSADGRSVATVGGSAVKWDLETREAVLAFEPGGDWNIELVAMSPNGMLASTDGHDVCVREADGAIRHRLSCRPNVESSLLEFSPDGARLACGGLGIKAARPRFLLWDVATGETLHEEKAPYYGAARFVDGGARLLCLADTRIEIRDGLTGECLDTVDFKGREAAFRCGALSPDGRLAAILEGDWKLRVWDARTGDLLHVLDGGTPFGAGPVRIAPGNRRVALADSENNAIHVWDLATGAPSETIDVGAAAPRALEWLAPTVLASGGDDCVTRIWEIGRE